MGVLQRFERRIEGLVNGAFAKAFKAEVQPVEIASALQRECDNRAAIVARGRTMVPNIFVVELGESDHERLSVYAETLGTELAEMVREHAEQQHYSFIGPLSVDFALANELDTGMFRVRSSAVAGATAAPSTSPSPSKNPSHEPAATPPPYLDVNGATFPLTKPVLVIGRGAEADLRIDDPGVSRRHAQLHVQGHQARVVDLGSTNGVMVDGRRTSQAELHDGSRFVLGSTTVVFRTGAR